MASRKPSSRKPSSRPGRGKIRYAVVGLGHIAQAAVLPAFRHAQGNSELAALVSDDSRKLSVLARRYGVEHTYTYDEFEACVHSGWVDAVYLTVPNHMHHDLAVRAARGGVHVLSEKPLALNEQECEDMIEACADNDVYLMTAYRLHFERANLEAIRTVQSRKLGDPRIFNSVFTMQVKAPNIRIQQETGGGTLYDIGIYCINAARYLFRAEPTEVFAFTGNNGETRFKEVEEMCGALLRFPGDRLATFVCSFGASDRASYEVIGTKGSLRLENAYEYSMPMQLQVKASGKSQTRRFATRDQFAAELLHFSNCILRNQPPEPSGIEGLIDVHIIRSLYESARKRRPITLRQLGRERRPSLSQEIFRPAVRPPPQVNVKEPTR